MQIHGFQKTTLLDYPEHVAATIFLGHCNFRCPFCHNKDLVLAANEMPLIDSNEIFSFLQKRSGILDGVCITGGEPTLSDGLTDFISKIKDIGLKVKLDTNGSHPDVIKYLVTNNLLDYVAMDIKSSLKQYPKVCGINSVDLDNVKESVSYLMSQSLPYEFRTTVIKELHTFEDILEIGHWIKGCRAYYLQPYLDSEQVIQPGFNSYSKKELINLQSQLKNYIDHVEIRGIDL